MGEIFIFCNNRSNSFIGSRHQDASSRIGATSIGEVSLSVASGSHLGMSSGQNVSFGGITHSNRESTMALAGSITGYVFIHLKCENENCFTIPFSVID